MFVCQSLSRLAYASLVCDSMASMEIIFKAIPWWPLPILAVTVINLIRYRADLTKEIRFPSFKKRG